jgi:hypothetical protein
VTETAGKLREFLVGFGMRVTGLADQEVIEKKLRNIRQDYDVIRNGKLGYGIIPTIRTPLINILNGLNGITNLKHFPRGDKSSISGKTKILMAIWGEVPGFDSVTRKNFVNRKQPYDNSGLPHLDNTKGVFSYTDHDIVDIIETLDTWVAAWPGQNSGKPFA